MESKNIGIFTINVNYIGKDIYLKLIIQNQDTRSQINPICII